MKRHTKIYVVRGSEDGIIGTYSNKKKAFEASLRYVGKNDAKIVVLRNGEIKTLDASYSTFTKEHSPEICNDGLVAYTEMFYLNQH